jgi:hypothetical protein
VRAGIVVVAVCGWRGVAVADPPDDAGPVPDDTLRVEAAISPSAGTVQAWQAHGAVGGQAELGVITGRLRLVGEAGLFELESDCPGALPCTIGGGAGDELRLGGDVRWSVVQTKVLRGVRGKHGRLERLDLWVELGGAAERIALDDAPTRWRPDVGAGVGVTVTNRAEGVGLGMRARVEVAPAMPDEDTRADTSFVLGMVVSFGG